MTAFKILRQATNLKTPHFLLLPVKYFSKFYGKTIREFNERALTKTNVNACLDISFLDRFAVTPQHPFYNPIIDVT